ncbi:hypothetical protein OLK001_31470 [Synechocystis sp. LKSZ1]
MLIGVSTLVLSLASVSRHLLFQSNALDLGFFDQVTYLISVDQPPITTFQDLHILGDHAAFIFYPLGLLYRLYPSVYWLLAVQALSLSLGAWPSYHLACQAGVKPAQAKAIAVVYLLYPLIFNVNLFDFHPEVIALPAILWAVWAAREQTLTQFIGAIILVLSCKAVLSLTVIFLGLWLLIWQRRRLYGAIALGSGAFWFIFTTQWLIPHFKGGEVAAVGRYDFLGSSVLEIAVNLLLKPQLVLGHLFTGANFIYLLLLIAPLLWGLTWRHLDPLIPALPALGLNLLTDHLPQKDLVHQYSIAIFPFLLIAVIDSLAHQRAWLQRPRWILLWALVAFLALAKFGYFTSLYLQNLDTWQASRQAIQQVRTSGGVLTTATLAPHLSHRVLIKLAINGAETLDLGQFDYVVLNQRHPGWEIEPGLLPRLRESLSQRHDFQLRYQQDEVVVFQKQSLQTGERQS